MTLQRNTLWNLGGVALPLAAALLCIPPLMTGFGLERFGVLALIWGLIGYLALFEFGLGRTMTVKLSQLAAADQAGVQASPNPSPQHTNLVRCGVGLGLAAGALGGLLTAGLAPWLVGQWLNIPAEMRTDALQAFFIASMGVLPTTGLGVARGVLEGTQRFAQSNALRLSVGVAGFALPWLTLQLAGPSLSWAAAAMVVGRFLCWFWALACLKPDLRLPTHRAAVTAQPWRKSADELLGFGGWLTLSSVVGPLMMYGDRFFLGASLPLPDVSRYVVVGEMVQRLLLLPTAFTSAWLPALASTDAATRLAQYRAGAWRFAAAMLAVCVVAGVLLEPLVGLWLGTATAQAIAPVGWVLCGSVFFNALGQLPFTLLHAGGQVRATALFHLVQLPLYLVALTLLAQHWGLLGAAWALLARTLVDWLGMHLLLRRRN